MRNFFSVTGAVSLTLIVAAPPSASAAMFRANFAGCKDKEVAREIFATNPAPRPGKGGATKQDAKPKMDQCAKFLQGQKITVDERDGDLWCVRPNGELECYWTLDKAVDIYDLGKSDKDRPEKKHEQ